MKGWWVRATGKREPVVYVAEVERLKRDASALLELAADIAGALNDGTDASRDAWNEKMVKARRLIRSCERKPA